MKELECNKFYVRRYSGKGDSSFCSDVTKVLYADPARRFIICQFSMFDDIYIETEDCFTKSEFMPVEELALEFKRQGYIGKFGNRTKPSINADGSKDTSFMGEGEQSFVLYEKPLLVSGDVSLSNQYMKMEDKLKLLKTKFMTHSHLEKDKNAWKYMGDSIETVYSDPQVLVDAWIEDAEKHNVDLYGQPRTTKDAIDAILSGRGSSSEKETLKGLKKKIKPDVIAALEIVSLNLETSGADKEQRANMKAWKEDLDKLRADYHARVAGRSGDHFEW